MNKKKEIKEFADEIRRTRESYFGQAECGNKGFGSSGR